jgi:hypothetical protein
MPRLIIEEILSNFLIKDFLYFPAFLQPYLFSVFLSFYFKTFGFVKKHHYCDWFNQGILAEGEGSVQLTSLL